MDPIARRKAPHIPDALLDQLLSGANPMCFGDAHRRRSSQPVQRLATPIGVRGAGRYTPTREAQPDIELLLRDWPAIDHVAVLDEDEPETGLGTNWKP